MYARDRDHVAARPVAARSRLSGPETDDPLTRAGRQLATYAVMAVLYYVLRGGLDV